MNKYTHGGLRDGAGRPLFQKDVLRVMNSYRLHPNTIHRLRDLSEEYKVSQGVLVDLAVQELNTDQFSK